MRRFMLLLLVAALLVPATAVAEAIYTFTSSTDGYKISYPNSFLAVTAENIDDVLSAVEAGTIDASTAAIIRSGESRFRSGIADAFFAPQNEMNVVVSFDPYEMTFTPETLVAEACPQMIEMYRATFTDLELLTPGNVWKAGNNEYAMFLVRGGGADGELRIVSQLLMSANNKLYSIAATLLGTADLGAMDQIFTSMMASFVPGA